MSNPRDHSAYYVPTRSYGKNQAIVSELANREMLAFRQALEEACMKALTDSKEGGKHGVLVVQDVESLSWRVSVSPYVPYGLIYEIRMPVDKAIEGENIRRVLEEQASGR